MNKALFIPTGFLLLAIAFGGAAGLAKADPSSPHPTVVLLTSLKSPKIWYRPPSWDLNTELEQNFRNAFNHSGFDLLVVHNASAVDLSNALRDPKNVGVFWVSHAAEGDDSGKSGIGRDDVILDIQGENVKDVFQIIHPNMRFVGVIGCEAQSIFLGFQNSGIYATNPHLKIFAFQDPVDALPGLTGALNFSTSVLGAKNDDLATSCPSFSPGVSIQISRSIDPTIPAEALTPALVYLGDHLIAVLPQPSPGETQQKMVSISNDVIASEMTSHGGELDLSVSSGFDGLPSVRPEFGNISFNSVLGSWGPFLDAKGKPVGVTKILFTHSGPVPALDASQLSPEPALGCQ